MSAVALFGSTGLVGSNILSTLLAPNSSATVVQTISRRAPKSTGPKLQSVVEPETSKWATSLKAFAPPPATVISALGTTRAQAGGIANQRKIDHDLNIELARASKEMGVRTFVFISSAGTRGPGSSYMPYAQMKVGVEDSVRDFDFEHAIILRPGLIIGARENNFVSDLMNWGVAGVGRIFGQGAKDKMGQDAEVIARAAVHAARLADEGKAPSKYWVLEGADVVRLGRTEWKD